jgi:hypothetical protein
VVVTSLADGRLSVEFQPGDEETASLIAVTCDNALRLAKSLWGLEPPTDCRLYVMASWREFIFRSAPWPWKLMLGVTYPAWSSRARRTWPSSAAWTQRYGKRVAIGIKPTRLLDVSDKSIGMHMYVEEKDASAKLRHLTCHELIHAASAHLALPAWLNEGLAALSVDRFLGKPTIRADSLELIKRTRPKGAPPSYRAMAALRGETLAYHAVRGYWIVRLLEDVHPGFLRTLLASRQEHRAIEQRVARQLDLRPKRFWLEIDDVMVEYFKNAGSAAT